MLTEGGTFNVVTVLVTVVLNLLDNAWKYTDDDKRIDVRAFVEAGRVWWGLQTRPELDGRDLGLKVGAGFGLRIRMGTSFVLRGDFAWSADGSGAYIDVNHIF